MRAPLALTLPLALAGATAAAETLPDGTAVGPPISHENVTVLPLLMATAPPAGEDSDYLVLDEGMAKGEVKVLERSGGGSVNELVVQNRSSRPLFLMSGEVVLGGQQDRIIGKDTIIPPKQQREVGVFCVEHGRWSGKDKSFRSANAMAHTKLRKQASFAGQGEVWSEVAEKNKVRGTDNDTDTYRRIATEERATRDARGYERTIGEALAGLPDRGRVVGVAVAIGGQVVAIEQFGSPGLFAKVSAKLLRSYYVEALDAPWPKGAPRAATAADVVAFARREKEAAEKTVLEEGGRATRRLEGKGVKGSKVIDDGSESARPVYKSLYAE